MFPDRTERGTFFDKEVRTQKLLADKIINESTSSHRFPFSEKRMKALEGGREDMEAKAKRGGRGGCSGEPGGEGSMGRAKRAQ